MRGREEPRSAAPAIACVALVALLAITGCGGDDSPSEAAVQEQIEQARKEGAREARQRDRIESLQDRVKRLERGGAAAAPAEVEKDGDEVTAPGTESATLRTFHTPNVSCEIRTDGAQCTVISIGRTFVFEDGGTAYIESGSRVPAGAGASAAWDSTVSAGSVTCTIPREDEPSGITCVDGATGHGFEASRVPERQEAY
jgi:hypothetical protein